MPQHHELQEMAGQGSSHRLSDLPDHHGGIGDDTQQRPTSSTYQRPKTPLTPQEHQPMIARALSRASSVTVRERPTVHLRSALWPIVVSLVYIGLCLYPWIVFCVTAKRPLGSKKEYSDLEWNEKKIKSYIKKHEHHMRAAEIISSIAPLATIPVTSAICSMAAVAYMQHGSSRLKMNLMQLGALVDQGWISPKVLFRLPKVGSKPLYIAIFITVVGCFAQIIQHALVYRVPTQAFKKNTHEDYVIHDVSDLLSRETAGGGEETIRLRSFLESAQEHAFEPFLWSEMHGDTFYSDTAKGTHNTVNAISTNLDEYPGTKINEAVFYFAPLPTTFTSGAFPMAQYIPRMNSTMEYLNVTVDEFPAECNNDLKMGFYASYQWGHESQLQPIRFEACMTGDLTTSPFHPTFDRQDITEILYLKRYIYADDSFTAYKITATTSLGYFEVPSMHNGHRAGPLMTKFPKSANDTIAIGKIPYISKRENNGTLLSNITTAANRNHGPLALLTVSLFGEGSFLDRHFKDPEGLALERPTIEDEDGWTTDIRSPTCVSLPPLAGISSWELTGCLTDYSYKAAPGTFRRIDEWLSSFDFTANARKTLSIALFYAHKTWLGGKGGGYSIYSPAKFERRIHYADGIPTFKSSLSTREILAGSALLGLHLLGLLVLAAYTWYLKPWVPWLGSEVMIRSGTAFADTLSAAQDQKEWEHTVQACPGFIGDDRPGETTGNMSFGAKASLGTGFGKRFTRSFA